MNILGGFIFGGIQKMLDNKDTKHAIKEESYGINTNKIGGNDQYIVSGYDNIGNSCWFNSALQAIKNISYYRNKIVEYKGEKHAEKAGDLFYNIIIQNKNTKNDLRELYDYLYNYANEKNMGEYKFTQYSQHEAHVLIKFLNYFLFGREVIDQISGSTLEYLDGTLGDRPYYAFIPLYDNNKKIRFNNNNTLNVEEMIKEYQNKSINIEKKLKLLIIDFQQQMYIDDMQINITNIKQEGIKEKMYALVKKIMDNINAWEIRLEKNIFNNIPKQLNNFVKNSESEFNILDDVLISSEWKAYKEFFKKMNINSNTNRDISVFLENESLLEIINKLQKGQTINYTYNHDHGYELEYDSIKKNAYFKIINNIHEMLISLTKFDLQSNNGVQVPQEIAFDDKTKFYLKSVILHSGNYGSGHYKTIIYDSNNGKYYQCNDDVITEYASNKDFQTIFRDFHPVYAFYETTKSLNIIYNKSVTGPSKTDETKKITKTQTSKYQHEIYYRGLDYRIYINKNDSKVKIYLKKKCENKDCKPNNELYNLHHYLLYIHDNSSINFIIADLKLYNKFVTIKKKLSCENTDCHIIDSYDNIYHRLLYQHKYGSSDNGSSDVGSSDVGSNSNILNITKKITALEKELKELNSSTEMSTDYKNKKNKFLVLFEKFKEVKTEIDKISNKNNEQEIDKIYQPFNALWITINQMIRTIEEAEEEKKIKLSDEIKKIIEEVKTANPRNISDKLTRVIDENRNNKEALVNYMNNTLSDFEKKIILYKQKLDGQTEKNDEINNALTIINQLLSVIKVNKQKIYDHHSQLILEEAQNFIKRAKDNGDIKKIIDIENVNSKTLDELNGIKNNCQNISSSVMDLLVALHFYMTDDAFTNGTYNLTDAVKHDMKARNDEVNKIIQEMEKKMIEILNAHNIKTEDERKVAVENKNRDEINVAVENKNRDEIRDIDLTESGGDKFKIRKIFIPYKEKDDKSDISTLKFYTNVISEIKKYYPNIKNENIKFNLINGANETFNEEGEGTTKAFREIGRKWFNDPTEFFKQINDYRYENIDKESIDKINRADRTKNKGVVKFKWSGKHCTPSGNDNQIYFGNIFHVHSINWTTPGSNKDNEKSENYVNFVKNYYKTIFNTLAKVKVSSHNIYVLHVPDIPGNVYGGTITPAIIKLVIDEIESGIINREIFKNILLVFSFSEDKYNEKFNVKGNSWVGNVIGMFSRRNS